MIEMERLALNRIASPNYGLGEFFELAKELGFSKVELRNDIRGGAIIDGMPAKEADKLARENGISIITINALQKFNLTAVREKNLGELRTMIELCKAIHCPAIVLCPNNDPKDTRTKEVRYKETVDALVAYGPIFKDAGMLGYVEPLGFGISSLASIVLAQNAIKESGFGCYKVLIDTFHLFLGPDDASTFGTSYDVSMTGLIHVSGVEDDIPPDQYLDCHRLLPGPRDNMKSKAVIEAALKKGYNGDISFEPFSDRVQNMSRKEFSDAMRASLKYLME
ncbi:MAG TPA: TIM barrel protein [Spirochaetales bacterium]|nr:TIM barrel protein [Spirochaetales bacterium]